MDPAVLTPFKPRETDDTRNNVKLPAPQRWWGECETVSCRKPSIGACTCNDGIEREFCESHQVFEF